MNVEQLELFIQNRTQLAPIPNTEPSSDTDTPATELARIIPLRPLSPEDQAFVEQNFGCEFPVCVSNRRHRKMEKIEFTTEKGAHFRLTRDVTGMFPGPEAYKFWLWFLTKCSQAAQKFSKQPLGSVPPPLIGIDPVELGEVFDAPKSKRDGSFGGSWYDLLDESFNLFADLRVTSRKAIWDAESKRHITLTGKEGLLSYWSWRERQDWSGQTAFDFKKGGARPSQLLWDSIRAGYGLSVGLLKDIGTLGFIALRLQTWLTKHGNLQPEAGWFASSILPKIPLQTPPDQLKRVLAGPHQELLDIGFFSQPATFSGRGKKLRIRYHLSQIND